jgi:hypothetical protein
MRHGLSLDHLSDQFGLFHRRAEVREVHRKKYPHLWRNIVCYGAPLALWVVWVAFFVMEFTRDFH